MAYTYKFPITGYRDNAYKHVEEKRHVMKAKYRWINWYTNKIIFQYKLAGQWFWRDGYIGSIKENTYNEVEKTVRNWLEFHSREGQV